jgi:hypothetical protein
MTEISLNAMQDMALIHGLEIRFKRRLHPIFRVQFFVIDSE